MQRLNKDLIELIVKLYNIGKNDSEIGKELGKSSKTIQAVRKRLNLKSKFTYKSLAKLDYNKFEELFYKGLSDAAIAKELNMSLDGVYSHRMRHSYYRDSLSTNKPIELTDFQKEVLIGTVLGDSSLRKQAANAKLVCSHGKKLKEYCLYKLEIFKSIGCSCNYHKRNTPDKRNGILYEDYTINTKCNPCLNFYYSSFYKDNKKVIPLNLLEDFSEVSLAFMYMDDGSKIGKTYSIATNCFKKEELILFQEMLLRKFNLHTSLFSNNVLYIKTKSAEHFTELILPYIHNSMLYKCHVIP